MVAAACAGTAATMGLILAAAITAVPDQRPAPPTPTGYRPTLVCDYAVTSSQCPQLSIPYAPPSTVRPRTTAPRGTVRPVPRPTRRR